MIGDRITTLRKERKWTQEEMSKNVNIPRSTYSNYENGRREPDFETIKIFADIFEVSIDFLLGRTKYKQVEYLLIEIEQLKKENQALRGAMLKIGEIVETV